MLLLEYDEQHLTNERTPALFRDTTMPSGHNWIARGTDGAFYIAPAMPGGWLHRREYEALPGSLEPVAAEEARTISWFLYGDIDTVQIASA